jgi:hypothetical protein
MSSSPVWDNSEQMWLARSSARRKSAMHSAPYDEPMSEAGSCSHGRTEGDDGLSRRLWSALHSSVSEQSTACHDTPLQCRSQQIRCAPCIPTRRAQSGHVETPTNSRNRDRTNLFVPIPEQESFVLDFGVSQDENLRHTNPRRTDCFPPRPSL